MLSGYCRKSEDELGTTSLAVSNIRSTAEIALQQTGTPEQ